MQYTLLLAGPEWLGEQRLRLTIDGEQIVDVDYRTPHDPPAPLSGRGPFEMLLAQAAARCATCGFAYALSLCQAAEHLHDLAIPPTAGRVRVGLAELERLTAHLGNVRTLLAAIGFQHDAQVLADLAGDAEAARATLGGARSSDLLALGGLAQRPEQGLCDAVCTQVAGIGQRLLGLADRSIDRRTLLARTVGVGVLSSEAVSGFRLQGPLARATALPADLRVDAPYAAYRELTPNVVVQQGGDVYARLVVLLLEALESSRLIEAALSDLPAGPWRTEATPANPVGEAAATVEAPRGPLHCRMVQEPAATEVYFRPAAPFDRLLARALLSGARLDDATLIVLSANHCAGCAGATNL